MKDVVMGKSGVELPTSEKPLDDPFKIKPLLTRVPEYDWGDFKYFVDHTGVVYVQSYESNYVTPFLGSINRLQPGHKIAANELVMCIQCYGVDFRIRIKNGPGGGIITVYECSNCGTSLKG